MSPAPVFVRIPASHHPGTWLRLVPGFRDPGSVLILGQVTQYGNLYLICIAKRLCSCMKAVPMSIGWPQKSYRRESYWMRFVLKLWTKNVTGYINDGDPDNAKMRDHIGIYGSVKLEQYDDHLKTLLEKYLCVLEMCHATDMRRMDMLPSRYWTHHLSDQITPWQ